MPTLEDIFFLYERNSRYYHDCNHKKCKTICYCYLKQEVRPFTIGDQNIPCKLKIKCYIIPGDICPICSESIMMKSSAFITDCGHHFHKKCIFKYIEFKWLSTSIFSCPICRCSLCYPLIVQRYRDSYFSDYRSKNENELDKLEEFWISQEYKLPRLCSSEYKHYLGCDKSCLICKYYIETGKEPARPNYYIKIITW